MAENEVRTDGLERDSEGFIILRRRYSELYKKTNYTSSVDRVQNRIYEYDLHSANVSALRATGKFDERMLDILENSEKQVREEAVGKMIRRDKTKTIYGYISRGIQRAKEQLFRFNGIKDDEVLTIKNDAVFVIGRKLQHTTFGPYEFRLKNVYAGYIRIDKIEIYYDKKHKSITIKGVSDMVVEHPDHQSGMLCFFLQVFRYLDLDQVQDLRDYLIRFARDYKALKLPHQYYRELNSNNIYRTKIELAGFEYNLTEIGPDDMDMINPIYNYRRFVLPLIQQFM